MGRLHVIAPLVLLHDAPIITNAMVASAGFSHSSNTNFPQPFEPASYATGLAGMGVCLPYTDHNSEEMRLAYAASFDTAPGGWTLLPPGDEFSTSLSMAALRAVTGLDEETYSNSDNHVSAGHFSEIDLGGGNRGYVCHGHAEIVDNPVDNQGWRHGQATAYSLPDMSPVRAALVELGFDSGLVAEYLPDVPANLIGRRYHWSPYQSGQGQAGNPTYVRPWKRTIGGVVNWFGVGNLGDLRRCVYDGTSTPDPLGLRKWARVSNASNWTNPPKAGGFTQIRHPCMLFDDASARGGYYIYTTPDEEDVDPAKSEHLRIIRAQTLGDDFADWRTVGAHWSLRESSTFAEGIDQPPGTASGAQNGRKRGILDPCAVRASDGNIYVAATSAGEQGILMYRWNGVGL